MKKYILGAAIASLLVAPAMSQSFPGANPVSTPGTSLPGAGVGAGIGLTVIAPIVGGLLAIGLVASGGSTNSTTSTSSTSSTN